jgi:outer membrane receptor for ferrienterochelin and colicins
VTGSGALPRVAVFLQTIVLCVMVVSTTHAQPPCPDAVREAETLYSDGDFRRVIGLLEDSCRVKNVARADRNRSYELRAEAHIAEKEFRQAQLLVNTLLKLNADYPMPSGASRLFREMVDRTRRTLVRSVSKFAEDWREAPATVAVITAEDIRRRGYFDVEAILHDLPGFDITRGNGDQYATIYQRGYRSNATDRTLVLIDGIEQNDLHSNIAYISRQYPLTSIDRIEVVYGPASTIYGPNAFSGVINIITKEPEGMIGSSGVHAASAQYGVGRFGTNVADVTYAGKGSRDSAVSWSVTGRIFTSDEANLADLTKNDPVSPWGYGFPDVFDRLDYTQGLTLEGKTLDKFLCARLAPNGGAGFVFDHPERCAVPTPQAASLMRAIQLGLAEAQRVGDVSQIAPTALGIARARALDKAMWAQQIGHPFSFSDPTKDWFFTGKVKFPDLTVGVQLWKNSEGTAPWYSDRTRGEGGLWVPRQTAIFANYARPLKENLSLNILLRYKNDQIDDESTIPLMATYASGYLGFLELLNNTPSQFIAYNLDQVSTQFRTEVTAQYNRSDVWNAVAGVDVRDASAQAGYFIRTNVPVGPLGLGANATPEEIKATDVGIFAQVSRSWGKVRETPTIGKWGSAFKMDLGLRYDSNQVRENERVPIRTLESPTPSIVEVDDFGDFWSPRIAGAVSIGKRDAQGSLTHPWIFKGIFSQASQQPSNYQRFAAEPYVRELPSPFLGREKARNFEFSVGADPYDWLRIEGSTYRVEYSDVLQTALVVDPCCTPARSGQFKSLGAFTVRGVQSTATAQVRRYSVYGNYTYTQALNSDRLTDIFGEELIFAGTAITKSPIGDIARHKLNFGGTASFWGWLDTGVRVNVVGRRPTGVATTSRANFADVPSYAVVNATVAYNEARHGLSFQLGLNNLFNTKYWDPGVRSAELYGFVGRIPQPGFNWFTRVLWDFNVDRPRTR